jgi:hypothetical protein
VMPRSMLRASSLIRRTDRVRLPLQAEGSPGGPFAKTPGA